MSGMRTFEDDDVGYTEWLARHPDGWVVNARRSPSGAYLKLHRSACATISELQSGYSRWTTGEYIKVCGDDLSELERWARAELGCELQTGCHCVQYGPTRPARRAARSSSPPETAAAVGPRRDEDGFVSVDAPGVIPYETEDEALLAAREQIGRLLAGMSAQPEELLHGVIEGSLADATDLDNALLYNVGGRVAAATRFGVLLERRAASEGGLRYRYRLTRDGGLGQRDERSTVAEFDSVRLGRAPRSWPDVWLAVRTADGVRVVADAPDGELTLWLRVGAPRFGGSVSAQFVKTFIDGVMVALHAHGDHDSIGEIAIRLAAQTRLTPAQIAALLMDSERAALRTCRQLVVIRGSGFQCRPEDHRIAALRIEIDRSAREWSMTGRLARA